MYDKPQLGLAQIRVAMNAMLDEANKDPGHPVAISVSDEQGNLLAYFSMDNTRPSAQRMAREEIVYGGLWRGGHAGLRGASQGARQKRGGAGRS